MSDGPKGTDKILADHKLWLDGKGGERANLRCANLRSADLRYVDLRYVDLRYANLRYANLRSADLRSADLRSANLYGASFLGAKGFYLLPVQDPRGYSFAHAVECEDGWRIRAGCRFFTIDQALRHWGEDYKGDREQGDMYLHAIEWLERKLQQGGEKEL